MSQILVRVKRAFLDFDDTLLDSNRFKAALFAALRRLYKIDAAIFKAQVEERRSDAGGYDLFSHLEDLYGIAPDEAERKLYRELAGTNYLFDDGLELLAFLERAGYEITILTTGANRYQRFKLSLYPELSRYNHIIIPGDKGKWLDQRLIEIEVGGLIFVDTESGTRHVCEWVLIVDDKITPFMHLRHRSRLVRYRVIREDTTQGNMRASSVVAEVYRLSSIWLPSEANPAA